MSEDGHCEHCDKQSCRWVSEGLAELHRDHNGAEWAGICPACAERERIVAWMRDHEGREKYHDTYWDQWVTVDLSKNDYADKIERGAHLEAHE